MCVAARRRRILDGVVQQCGDGDILIGAMLECERGDRHHVRHVGDARLLAELLPVHELGEREGSWQSGR